jgi:cytochrome c
MQKLFWTVLCLTASLACNANTVLVFSKTNGFRHPSISDGLTLLQNLAAANAITLETTEDSTQFNATNLARFDAVVWLSTTGDVLNAGEQTAFENWMQAGGGYVGIHASSDCEYDWSWYGTNILGNGAWFRSHPAIQTASLIVESSNDPSTQHLPATFSMTDEWYNFRANPRSSAQVLLRIDETSYAPGANAMGADHPISWKRAVGSGRAFYTALGHRPEQYTDPRFTQHVLGGLLWTLNRTPTEFANGFE